MRTALDAAGLEPADDLVLAGDRTLLSSTELGSELLNLTETPTAVFASNDDMAPAVLMAVKMAMSVAGEVLIAGFEDALTSRVT